MTFVNFLTKYFAEVTSKSPPPQTGEGFAVKL